MTFWGACDLPFNSERQKDLLGGARHAFNNLYYKLAEPNHFVYL